MDNKRERPISVLFMIEGGKALQMVKQQIAETQRVFKENRDLAKELGVKEIMIDRLTGALSGVIFPSGDIHPEFTKPQKRTGASFPKRRTTWHARLKAQKGYRNPSEWISTEFNIPLSITYRGNGGHGWRCIGSMLTECGFLYLGEDGPYAMWVPDVPGEVAADIGKGYVVEEPAASFKLEFDGCRRIEDEEWEILVLQQNLNKKKAAA